MIKLKSHRCLFESDLNGRRWCIDPDVGTKCWLSNCFKSGCHRFVVRG